jgi:hypothetical protein
VADTIAYIENQATHHKKMTFREELESILNKHGIEYEEWMLDSSSSARHSVIPPFRHSAIGADAKPQGGCETTGRVQSGSRTRKQVKDKRAKEFLKKPVRPNDNSPAIHRGVKDRTFHDESRQGRKKLNSTVSTEESVAPEGLGRLCDMVSHRWKRWAIVGCPWRDKNSVVNTPNRTLDT